MILNRLQAYTLTLSLLLIGTLFGCSNNLNTETKPRILVDQTTTPRNILNSRLVNRARDEELPFLTVGKLIELADRYQSCQCVSTRFVSRWEKTTSGYLLYSYFYNSQPIEFVCNTSNKGSTCFIREVDRGKQITSLNERFAPGSSLIKFIYDKGVKCSDIDACK